MRTDLIVGRYYWKDIHHPCKSTKKQVNNVDWDSIDHSKQKTFILRINEKLKFTYRRINIRIMTEIMMDKMPSDTTGTNYVIHCWYILRTGKTIDWLPFM